MSKKVVLPKLKNLGQLLLTPASGVNPHMFCQKPRCQKPTKFEITSKKRYKGKNKFYFASCANQECADWIVENRIRIMDK